MLKNCNTRSFFKPQISPVGCGLNDIPTHHKYYSSHTAEVAATEGIQAEVRRKKDTSVAKSVPDVFVDMDVLFLVSEHVDVCVRVFGRTRI